MFSWRAHGLPGSPPQTHELILRIGTVTWVPRQRISQFSRACLVFNHATIVGASQMERQRPTLSVDWMPWAIAKSGRGGDRIV
jgi:hypothetical protein